MIDVVALGELLIDFAAKSTDSAGYPTMAANPGGAPGNFLAALNAYGRKTAFLGKVGNDAFGNLLLGTLNAAGIETKGILVDDSVFTTLAFVTFDESGDRSFSFARKPGADTQLRWEEVDKSLIDEAKVFHFGTLEPDGRTCPHGDPKGGGLRQSAGEAHQLRPQSAASPVAGCGRSEGADALESASGGRGENQRQRSGISLELHPGGGRGQAADGVRRVPRHGDAGA